MNPQDEHNRKIYQSLKKAVAEAIDRKRKLGQHVVVIEAGKPVLIEFNDNRVVTPPVAEK